MRNRTNRFFKALALCMALALVFVMGVPAAAAEITSGEQKGSITVQGVETDNNVEVKFYKIISTVWDNEANQPKEPVYQWEATVAEWLTTNGYAAYVGDDNAVTDSYYDLKAADLRALTGSLAEYLAGQGTEAAYTGILNAENAHQITWNEAAMGQYIIAAGDAEDGHTHSVASANLAPEWNEAAGKWELNDITVNLKGQGLNIEKSVNDKNVGIGTEVTYTLDAMIPSYPEDAKATTFKLEDVLAKGLTFEKDSLTVKLGTAEAAGEIVLDKDTDYTVTEADGKVTIEFAYKNVAEKQEENTHIYAEYKAVVNENAWSENGKMTNTATLFYNSDPYDATEAGIVTDEAAVDIYTYGITVTKVDSKNQAIQNNNAVFKVYTDKSAPAGQEIKFERISDGVYRLNPAGNAEIQTGSDGTLMVYGLNEGNYYFKETKAPNGYLLKSSLDQVQLSDTDGNGKLTNYTDGSEAGELTDNVYKINIVNKKIGEDPDDPEGNDFVLPMTGGVGTAIFVAAGILLISGGVILIAASRRRNSR